MEELLVKEMDTRYSSTACLHDCCLRTVLCMTFDQSSDSLILLIKTNSEALAHRPFPCAQDQQHVR